MVLKKGRDNNIDAVKAVQKVLGLNDDGDFGRLTKDAVIKYQTKYKLKVDGAVGRGTATHMGINLDEYLDTDRTNVDDSNDTDGVVKMLGSYTTEDGLVIDRAYLDSDEYVRDYGKIEPRNFFIHHTAGWNNPYSTIKSWNKDKRGRVGTQYCIGGTSVTKGKYGDDKYNGTVVECFPDNYIAWHLGKVGDFNMSKYSSAVEINNFGYATKKDGKYYNYVNVEMPEEMICDLGYKFRGHQYWHAYTPEQIKSLELLIKHVRKIYPQIDIVAGLPQLLKDGIHPKDAFDFNKDAYNGKVKGLWTHTNTRKDKFDMSPQPNLVKMLMNL